MQEIKLWEIIPHNEPTVTKNCPKCGNNSCFDNSGNFRVNANNNKLDVWLIYQCNKCKSTWNMTILTRINPKTISPLIYQRFISNDKELAREYGFDINIHSVNKAIMNYENVTYDIVGDTINLDQQSKPIQIKIKSTYHIDVRLDKILSSKLGVSREYIKKLGKNKIITLEDNKELHKVKLKNDLIITIHPILEEANEKNHINQKIV